MAPPARNMVRAVRAPPRLIPETDDARRATAALEVVAAAALLWVLEGPVEVEEEPVLLLLEPPEALPDTRAESLESLTKDAVTEAFLQAEGGSMDPETKLAATHYHLD